MNLEILGEIDAFRYVPKDRTYVIQIFSGMSFSGVPVERVQLRPYDLYTIKQYVFDNDFPGGWGKCDDTSVTLDRVLASQIATDFKEHGLDKDTLLVHCTEGKNRSPSVAIALNEAFNLGHDTDELKQKFPGYNPFIYNLIKRAARNPLL